MIYQIFSILLTFGCMLISANSVAGTVSYDFRFDMQSRDYDNDSNTAGIQDYMRFYVNRGRLDFQGKLNDEVNYRFRFRFNQPQAGKTNASGSPTVNERDSLGNWVDYAYVQQKFYDLASITFGKFASDIGGYEAAASADWYIPSNGYQSNTFTSTAGGLTFGGSYQFYSGVKVAALFENQELALHVANAENSDYQVASQFAQNKTMTGLVWKGKFFNGHWLPLYSFHQVDTGPSTVTNGKLRFIGLGNRITWEDFMVDLDLNSNTYQDDSPGEQIKNNMLGMSFSYKLGTLLPKLQINSGNLIRRASTAATETTTKQTAAAIALEYTPDLKDRFRYHVALTSTTVKPDGGGTDQKFTDIIFGTRLLGDFLKTP